MVTLTIGLKAGTLMESLIAMIIIIVCISISAIIYTNVLDSDKQYLKLKANQILNQEAVAAKSKRDILDTEIKSGDWTIKKKFEVYTQTENLLKLSLTAINNNSNVVVERNELIVLEE